MWGFFQSQYFKVMKPILLFTICLISLLLWSCTAKDSSMYLITGSYADPDSEGIKVFRFNANTGDAEYVSGLTGIPNPSYLTPSQDGQRVYAVGEDHQSTSSANAIAFNPQSGAIKLLNSQPTYGGAPCYITIDPSHQYVLTANYMGGSISIFALDKERKLADKPCRLISFEGHGLDTARQSQPHLHCVAFTPDGQYLLADDLGTDQIHIFPIAGATTEGATESLLDEDGLHDVEVTPGSGPRHIVFHPSGKHAYLINEISGEVTVFEYGNGELDPVQYIAADTVGAQGSGDIHISPDGRFVYASNRLKADGIAIFSVDESTSMLTKVGYQPTGIHPRNFVLTPDGSRLLVACRDDNMIQVFRRDASTGLLSDMHKDIKTEKPVCLKFIGRE